MKGTIFDISRGCFDDGPGLRSVVFLKGCPLDCPWCQNPEGRASRPEILFDRQRCVGCDGCVAACPRRWSSAALPDAWRRGCTACGRCAERCPSRARQLAGRRVSVDELTGALLDDLSFFRGTGGGVTFSGGEPLAQPKFVLACSEVLRAAGVHVAVETSGHWPNRLLAELLPGVDLLLFDLKHADLDKYQQVIGAEPRLALDNLTASLAASMPLEVRITLVPGFNDHDNDLRHIARWLLEAARAANAPLPPVRLLGFHRMASFKAQLLDRPYPYAHQPPVSDEQLDAAIEALKRHGLDAVES